MPADSPTPPPDVNPLNLTTTTTTTTRPSEAEELSAALSAVLGRACEAEERADRARAEVQRLRRQLCDVAEDRERAAEAHRELARRVWTAATGSAPETVPSDNDCAFAVRELAVRLDGARALTRECAEGQRAALDIAERHVDALRRAERWQSEALHVFGELAQLAERAHDDHPTATTRTIRDVLRAVTVVSPSAPVSGEHLTAQGMGLDYE